MHRAGTRGRDPPGGSCRAGTPGGDHGDRHTGDGTRHHGGEHGRHRGGDALARAESERPEDGGIAGTALQMARHGLSDDQRTRSRRDHRCQQQGVALQRRRPMDRLGVDLLVRRVAEGADERREVGGERRRIDAVGDLQRQDRARLLGLPPATLGERRPGEENELGPRILDEVLAEPDDADDEGVADGDLLAVEARQGGDGTRSPARIPARSAPRSLSRISSVLPGAG